MDWDDLYEIKARIDKLIGDNGSKMPTIKDLDDNFEAYDVYVAMESLQGAMNNMGL